MVCDNCFIPGNMKEAGLVLNSSNCWLIRDRSLITGRGVGGYKMIIGGKFYPYNKAGWGRGAFLAMLKGGGGGH